MSEVQDIAERRRALDPRGSFIVQAPAGSGKTELLIQRYLVLLANVAKPEEIAAITFTRKAAAEMRKRIFEALAFARGHPKPQRPHMVATWELARAVLDRDAALGWHLEEQRGRLRIQTIDALCASLARQMPVLSRFGAQPEIVDDARTLYAEAARNALGALDDPADAAAADVERLLAHMDNNAVLAEALLAAMLQRRDHWIRALHGAHDRERLEAALAELRGEAIARVRALFPRLPDAPPLPADDAVDEWIALSKELLTKEGTWRKRHHVAQALCAEDALCEALFALQQLPPGRYSESQWEALGAMARLLPRAMAELKLVFARHGEADFVEISQGAVRALEGEDGPTDLLLSLDYRIRHILVDEFQDTSFTQLELLEKLTAGWEPGDGRTLFVVGDPMQSIYRFRQAEVALFLAAQRDGIGGVALEPLRLSANFRSQAGIVDWVNTAFARVMPAEDDMASGAVRYSPSSAVHPREARSVSMHAFAAGDGMAEARRVAEVAARALDAPARDTGRPSTVAILVRNRGHLLHIVPQLKAAGLKFRAIEIEPLGHRPVVQDLLSLTRALTHLADRTAWLAVLRAPWCGSRLADLHALANAGHATLWDAIRDDSCVQALPEDAASRVVRLRDALAPALRSRRRATLRNTVEGAWLCLAGPACVEGMTDLEDAQVYLDFLEESERAGVIADPLAFVEGVGALFALPDVNASERLQVMTVHRAKGLEFDTVIVPGLGAGSGRDDRALLLWMERVTSDAHARARLLLAPINPAGSDADPIYEYIRCLDKEKSRHECGRLLYVAATRARRELHLLACMGADDHGAPKPPPKGSLLATLWPAVGAQFIEVLAREPRPAAPPADTGEALQSELLVRLRDAVAFDPPTAVAWVAPAEKARERVEIEFSWVGETARRVGSVVHRWLQRIADDEMKGWDAARVHALRAAIRNELASHGVAQGEIEAAAERVHKALAASLADERGRWLLGPQARARNEYRLTALVEGERRLLVIDRVFADSQGRPWIVDYKTSTHEGGDLERFLAEEQARYREQLERYARALFPGENVCLGLYFPLLRGWREWRTEREKITS